ncbi:MULTISPECIES: hypothetical protein [Enterobacter]|uniref:hypothetical protein n=1 Tax=Enterobacter TaxID=547 RepID=UPI0021AE5020|nr:hypothetical protein [Enterobacter sp. NIC22-4]
MRAQCSPPKRTWRLQRVPVVMLSPSARLVSESALSRCQRVSRRVWVGRPALFSSPAWLEKLLLNRPGSGPEADSVVCALSWRFPSDSLA